MFKLTMATLVSIAIFACLSSVCTLSFTSHYGSTFDIGMIPMVFLDPDITIDIASNASGQIKLYIPFLNINRTQALNKGLTTITVENQILRRGNFTERRGINIQTDVPVAVFVTLYRSGITESYLALPVTFAGKSYLLASFEPAYIDYSEALIVSSYTKTVVNITTKRLKPSLVSLNWLNATQIAEGHDMSGTSISSNAPVSVISGTTCAYVPKSYNGYCGLLVEQLIPTDAWENEYIVPCMPPRKGVLIQVLGHKHQDVCFYTQRGSICKQIPYPNPLEFSTGPEPVFVRSNSTISVMSYGIEDGPFMITVPGIKNFINNYYFIVPTSYTNHRNSLAVVIQSTHITGLSLDGIKITTSHTFNVPSPYDSYKVLIINISTGYHTLSHQNRDVKFGAFSYGNGNTAGYGLPLGIQKETVTVTEKKDDISICYYCNEMFHVELCDVVKRCSKNEICYLKRFLKHDRQTFRSGCLSQEVCLKQSETAANDPDTCIECCSESYCNHIGCGETGLPARDQRGPLCYNCEYAFTPDECDTLQLCVQGQVCRIEETRWGTHSNFRMGCADASCSPVQRSVHVLPRSTPTCQACCSDDYCNLNCTMGPGHGQPAIVG